MWCNSCVQALPGLDALAKRMMAVGKSFTFWTIVMVNSNDEEREPEKIRAMRATNNITLPVLIDRDSVVAECYGIKALPTTVIVDDQGVVQVIELALGLNKLEMLIPA